MMPVAIGMAIGLVTSFLLTRILRALLFGVSATDPSTFVVYAPLLATVALFACWIPARSAAKLDPIQALRYE